MTYVITGVCTTSKDMSCVAVCPVDCIHPVAGEPGFDDAEQPFINPDECIDCDACVPACPVDARRPGDQLSDEELKFSAINARYFSRR
jgi:NAD-dependent dihydropyrimidine dehydrogenase PreA subunit